MRPKSDKNYSHSKHLAFQIVAQLPEDQTEALQVLEYVRKILQMPLDDPAPVAQLQIVKTPT